MQLCGSKVKTSFLEQRACYKIQQSHPKMLINEPKSSYLLHRRYSQNNNEAIQEIFKVEDKYQKQLNHILQTKYLNMIQLFKKKQFFPNCFRQDTHPFQHVVTNQLSNTINQNTQTKRKQNSKEWHKVNFDKYKYLSRQCSIEKLNTHRQQSIEPCLKVLPYNKQERGVSQMNKNRTETNFLKNRDLCKCTRSKSLQKDNLIIFLIEEQLNKSQDRILKNQ